MNNKMSRLLKKLGLSLIVTTITTTSIVANETDNKPKFSMWAFKELNEAICYGLINMQNIEEDDMQCPINEARLRELCDNVSDKIGEIPGVTKKAELNIAMPKSGEITKQEMSSILHTILLNYEYDTEFKFDITNISSCIKNLEVIKGDGKSEGLENICTVEQAIIMSRRLIESIYDLCDADSRGVFWKVENDGNTVYLLGSIHIGKAGMYPIRDEVMEAYESSDDIYMEIDALQEIPKEVLDMQYYLDGTTIKDHLSAEYYDKLTRLLKEYNTTPEEFGNMKDWAIMLELDYLEVGTAKENEDFSENDTMGVEDLFIGSAIMDQKGIKGLETYEEHLGALDINMSQEVKTYKLEQMIDEKLYNKDQSTEEENYGVKIINQIQEDWINGDIDKLSAAFWEEEEEEIKQLPKEQQELEAQFSKALIDDRDQIMADSIDEVLQSKEGKTYFIIAGAAHFVAEVGVLSRLQEKGYKIERIN